MKNRTKYIAAVLIAGLSFGAGAIASKVPPSYVGDHVVPSGLKCAEDEIIGFDTAGNLTCVHIDVIASR